MNSETRGVKCPSGYVKRYQFSHQRITEGEGYGFAFQSVQQYYWRWDSVCVSEALEAKFVDCLKRMDNVWPELKNTMFYTSYEAYMQLKAVDESDKLKKDPL